MSHRANPLSFLGKMSYGVHLLFYPGALGVYLLVVKPYLAARNEKSEKDQWESMPKLGKVDPDIFNPFTPIPYHNNKELKYGFAHINLFNYANANHMNAREYVWRDYHNSFDHNNTNAYMYNWVSMHGPKE